MLLNLQFDKHIKMSQLKHFHAIMFLHIFVFFCVLPFWM